VLEPLEISKRRSGRQVGFAEDGDIAAARYFDKVRDAEPSVVAIRHGSTVLRFAHGELTGVS
jgi:hypothetical protein